jgi:hypothetical protein
MTEKQNNQLPDQSARFMKPGRSDPMSNFFNRVDEKRLESENRPDLLFKYGSNPFYDISVK